MIHCWKGYREWLEENVTDYMVSAEWGESWDNSKTCFLVAGHAGEHEWTDDSEIVITFERMPCKDTL